MSIRVLKTFLAVAKHGNLAAAANEIGLTQPAVSLQMKSLESELKLPLFDRSRRSVVLNTTGRNLVPRVAEIVERYDGLALAADPRTFGGTLHIGAISITFARLLPDALLRLRRRYPRVDLRVSNGSSEVLAAKVERGELDAALASNPPAPLPRLLLWHPLLNEPFVFIAPRRFAGATISEALARYPFIRLTRHTWTGRMVESALRAARLAPRDAMELDSTDIVSEMVGRGLGVSVIPLDDGKWRDNPALRILRIRGLTAERVVGLVERRSHSKAALVAAFRQCLAGVRRSARGRLREIPIA